jgi:hypothetical protein
MDVPPGPEVKDKGSRKREAMEKLRSKNKKKQKKNVVVEIKTEDPVAKSEEPVQEVEESKTPATQLPEQESLEDKKVNKEGLESRDKFYAELKEGLDNLNTTMTNLAPGLTETLLGAFGPLLDNISVNQLGPSQFPKPKTTMWAVKNPTPRKDFLQRRSSSISF